MSSSLREEAEAAERAAGRRAGELERLRGEAEARILDWSRQVRRDVGSAPEARVGVCPAESLRLMHCCIA